jgi:hypothetical protein
MRWDTTPFISSTISANNAGQASLRRNFVGDRINYVTNFLESTLLFDLQSPDASMAPLHPGIN